MLPVVKTDISLFIQQFASRNLHVAELLLPMTIFPNVLRKEMQVCHLTYLYAFANLTSTFAFTVVWNVLMVFLFSSWKYTVKPRRGDALLFFSLHTNAIPDPVSLHSGCPVIEGEKWSATKWIHVDSFDKIVEEGGDCTDNNASCERWAALGECTKNPEYMVGSAQLPGFCRRSCKVC